MARVFKHTTLNDEAFPLPEAPAERPRFFGVAGQQQAHQPAPTMHDEDAQRTAADLAAIVDRVAELRPAIDAMADTLREKARQEGYEAGRMQAEQELQSHLMEAMAALGAAQQERHAIAQQHSAALGDMALKIARKVIDAHLEVDPSLVARIVEKAIEDIEPSGEIVVHVHPDDVPVIAAHQQMLDRLVHAGGVRVVGDASVGRGGCIISSNTGDVDARIETRLGVLEAAFASQHAAPRITPDAAPGGFTA